MTNPRKPLADILAGGNGGHNDDIFDRFDSAEAADDFGPLPKGVYVRSPSAAGSTRPAPGPTATRSSSG